MGAVDGVADILFRIKYVEWVCRQVFSLYLLMILFGSYPGVGLLLGLSSFLRLAPPPAFEITYYRK